MTDFESSPDDGPGDESKTLNELRRIAGGACRDCGIRYSARDAVGSIALGFKNAPRCLDCTANRLDRPRADLERDLRDYVHRRECFLRAWREAERMDGVTAQETGSDSQTTAAKTVSIAADVAWDAGPLGCGELLMGLRIRLTAMAPGQVIRVTAADPSAPEDIPAWCRLCGHTLLGVYERDYFIRRKDG